MFGGKYQNTVLFAMFISIMGQMSRMRKALVRHPAFIKSGTEIFGNFPQKSKNLIKRTGKCSG